MNRTPTLLLALALALALPACDRGSQSHSQTQSQPPSQPQTQTQTPSPTLKNPGIKWLQAPAGLLDATDAIRDALAKEKTEGRTMLVYVGATWCEPCQRFHHAVENRELDAAFPALSILAFDSDRDGEALANAGYYSRLIPLLALPNADGKSSGKQIEGGIKGEGAVGDITPRLKSLLTGS